MNSNIKKDIIGSTIIIVIFLTLFILINLYYIYEVQSNKIIYKQEAEWQKYRQNLSNNTLEYAFFGDSHAAIGFNPTYVNNSFNFASTGEDYVETYYKINKLINHEQIKINYFVLEIDPHTFSDGMREKERLFQEPWYFKQFISLQEISTLKNEFILKTFFKANYPVIGKGSEIIKYIFLKPEITQVKMGWINKTGNFSEQNRTKVTYLTYTKEFSKNPNLLENTSFEHFKRILRIANENNITIIFIKYPLPRDYDSALKENNISIEEHYNKLFSEIEKENKNYQVLDYYNIFIDDIELFSDADHVNYIGSDILSQKIREDLEK
jgi:hypothetical protein